jgi:hypothetical protein
MYRVHLTDQQREDLRRRTHAPGVAPRTRDRLDRTGGKVGTRRTALPGGHGTDGQSRAKRRLCDISEDHADNVVEEDYI